MAEFGQTLGLAQDFQSNERINDLYRREEANSRARATAEARAKMFADDVKVKGAMNAFDNKIIKEETQAAILQLGDWINKNKDYTYNPQKRMVYNQKIEEMKSSQSVMRGMASDAAMADLDKDLAEVAKSPEMYDQDAYADLLAQKQNYLKAGNQKGVDGAVKEGLQSFVYQKPRNFVDLPKTLMGYGGEIQNYDIVKPKGGNVGEYYTKPVDSDINAIKQSAYQQHGRQIQIEAKKLGLNNPQEIDNWVTSNIAAGFKKHYSIGDANAAFSNAMRMKEYDLHKAKAKQGLQTNPSYQPFDYLVDPKNRAGTMAPDDIKKVFGDKPVSPLYGNDGSKVDLSGSTVEYDGRYVKNNGIPFFLGKVYMPLDVAEEKGIYKDPFGPNLSRTGTITPAFLDKARIYDGTDKEGKAIKMVQVDYEIPVNPSDKIARDKMNTLVLPDKMMEPGANPFMGQQQSSVQSASLSEWKSAGWSDADIQRAVNEGKIKVK